MAGANKIALGFTFALGFLCVNTLAKLYVPADKICELVPNEVFISNRNESCASWVLCKDHTVNFSGKCDDGYYFDLSMGGCNYKSKVKCDHCKLRRDGLFVKDPGSCQNYFFCFGNKEYLGSCADDKFFDEDKQQCDVDEKLCSRKPTIRDPLCREIPDGRYISYPGDCQKSIICKNQRAFEVACPRGFVFDSTKGICDFEYMVNCNKCRGIFDQYFIPDTEDGLCKSYYTCADQEVLLRGKCEDPNVFDEEKQKCVAPSTVAACSIEPCKYKKDDYSFQDRDECTQYIQCKKGGPTPKICPLVPGTSINMQFNEKTQECDLPGTFDCI